MKTFAAILVCLLVPVVCRADQQIADAQRNLKDLGFYYGDVTGEKSQETNDAVRRYQIRSGLNITGELNDETIQALKKSAAAEAAATPNTVPSQSSPPRGPDPAIRQPQQPPNGGEPDSNAPRQPLQTQPAQPYPAQPGQPYQPGPAPVFPGQAPGLPPDDVYEGRGLPPVNGAFAGTPYQIAPPEVQRRVIMDAQKTLAGIGLYKHPVDGNMGADLEFSLRAYQARVHLRPTGRLDLETLAALELLPGPRRHFFQRRALPPPGQPPVRGEWVRP